MEARQFLNFSSREFDRRILFSLGQLQREKDFCDITITCEGHKIEAHKVVLARGSRLFNKILKLNTQLRPLIILRDVKFSYLLNILDFMYQGEVRIDKREFGNFLAVARDLEVNDLFEEAFKNSKESDVNKSEMQQLDSSPKQLNFRVDYKVKTDNNVDDVLAIVNYLKVNEFEDFETFPNEDKANNINIKKDPMDSSSKQDLIIKIEIENENSEIKGETIPLQDSVNKQSNTHEQRLRIRDIAKLTADKDQDQSTSFELDISKSSFECEQCNKTYSSKNDLSKHVLSVHKGKRYPCSHCNYKAKTKDFLKSHTLNIHEGKRYPCSHCNYKAASKQSLENHVLSAHKEITFACPQCDYKATNKTKLKTHVMSIHKGERYPCSHCDYKATAKQYLEEHVISIHEGMKFPCPHCDYKATRKIWLKAHIKNYHSKIQLYNN